MSSARHLLSTALRGGRALASRSQRNHFNQSHVLPPVTRFYASLNAKKTEEEHLQNAEQEGATPNPNHAASPPVEAPHDPKSAEESAEDEKPGAIGGFMRGLMGGQQVAVQDAFIAEAKEQGVELPPPPPPRRTDLVPVKRRKRREDDAESEQTIRDRLFGRFAGSAFMQGAFNAKERIAERIDESDNPVINMFRNFYDRFFAENEMAMVVREIREEDPQFRISEFLRQVEIDLVPKILGAYLSGDRPTLEKGCTEGAYAMLNASIRERDTEGVVMDTNILDVSDVELTAGRVLEDSPVLIVTFNTQQINCLRDRGGNVVEGSEDDIRAVYYAWAFVREAEYEEATPSGGGMHADAETDGAGEGAKNSEGADEESNKEKEGGAEETEDGEKMRPWKLMEMVIRGAHSTI